MGGRHDPTAGERAVPPRWAPFPVQDWDAYQRTPAWQEYAAARAAPVASTPPPGRRAPWAAVALALCCLLAAGAYLVADLRPTPPVSAWVPADGAAATVLLQTSSGPVPGTVEQAVLSWRRATQATAAPFADAVLANHRARTGLLWRQVLQPARTDLAPGVTLLAVDAAQVNLIAERDILNQDHDAAGEDAGDRGNGYRGHARVFDPGLRLAGPAVRPGSSWHDSGRVTMPGTTTEGSYRARLSATASAACLVIHATLDLTVDDAVTAEQRTWRLCPGAGIVAAQRTTSAGSTGFAPTTEPLPPVADDAPAPGRLTAPHGGPEQATVTAGTGPAYRRLLGAPGISAPVALPAGAVARADTSGQDVIVFDPDAAGLMVRRRLHPGGSILGVGVVGGTIMADTTTRHLVAWSPTGLRRWVAPLAETLAFGVLAADAHTAVTVNVSGRLSAWDVRTGTRRWSVRLPGAPTAAPVTGDGLVVVADRSDTLTAVDLATGRQRWQRDAEDLSVLAVQGGQVAAASVGFLSAYDLHTGARRWTTRTDAAVQSLVPVASGWIVAGSHLLQAIDDAGRQRWRQDGCATSTVTPDWTICWDGAAGRVVSSGTGASVATLAVPDLTGTPVTLLSGERLWLFDPGTYAAWFWPVGG